MNLIEILANKGYSNAIQNIASQQEAVDCWFGPEGEDGRRLSRLVVKSEKIQEVLDALQSALSEAEAARITLSSLDATLPRPPASDEEKKRSVTASREALYDSVEKNARLDRNFLVLVFLSTTVAAIGLIENSAAVIIGAMVIAPLLGPNLALALGSALGDRYLMGRALVSNFGGLALAVGMSVAIGVVSPAIHPGPELLARTEVGLDSVALALASGAAAVLSITSGLPSVLVGVMVAVALLPPAAAFGLMLGSRELNLAMGAGLLLAVNVVCVNLAAKIVFLVQGIRPRTWMEKEAARQSMATYIAIWIVSLAILVGLIYARR